MMDIEVKNTICDDVNTGKVLRNKLRESQQIQSAQSLISENLVIDNIVASYITAGRNFMLQREE